MTGKRRLRARLAGLYACLLLGSGAVLLVIADLPLTSTGRAHSVGERPATARSFSNLPEVLAYSAIALGVLAVVSLALGWLVAGRALRPLRAITGAARAISASSLSERLSLADTYEEFRELGDTLNGLFTRLEGAFESQRHFVANASHELRTPLAAERTVLQVALADPDASVDSLRAACQQLLELGQQQERLIDALLTLATSQRGLRTRESFDLADVTARVVTARAGTGQQEAASQGVRIQTHLAPAIVTGDPSLAESLVTNLVDNAVRHNVADGNVEVATGTPAGLPCFVISNSGPVIPPCEVGRLFEPFRQLAGERTRHDGGHGLGLAIVSAVASAHGASLTARARPEGGLDVTVTFRP